MKYIAIVLVFVGIGFATAPLANAQETMTNQELTALVFSLQARIETLESMLNVVTPQATPTQATTTVQNITPPRISTPSTFDVARCRGSIRCAKP